MRLWSWRTILLLTLSILFVYLVDLLTIPPNVTSGNGNLALLFVPPAMLIFFLFASSLWKDLGRLELKSKTRLYLCIGSLVLLLLLCFLDYQFASNLINRLGGSPETESSRIYRFPWLNQYTNTMFINLYTLSILVTGVTFLKSIFHRKCSIFKNFPN